MKGPSRYTESRSAEGKFPALGTSSYLSGHVSARCPEGFTSPISTLAAAHAPACPDSPIYTAACVPSSQSVSTLEPDTSTIMIGLPAFLSSSSILTCARGICIVLRSSPSDSDRSSSPIHTTSSSTSSRCASTAASAASPGCDAPCRSYPWAYPETVIPSLLLNSSRRLSTRAALTLEDPDPWYRAVCAISPITARRAPFRIGKTGAPSLPGSFLRRTMDFSAISRAIL